MASQSRPDCIPLCQERDIAMRAIFSLAAIILASTGSFASAVGQGATSKPATASNVPDPSDRICKDLLVPGSRMVTRRYCATRAEWAIREREEKDATQLMQRPIQTCTPIMGSPRC